MYKGSDFAAPPEWGHLRLLLRWLLCSSIAFLHYTMLLFPVWTFEIYCPEYTSCPKCCLAGFHWKSCFAKRKYSFKRSPKIGTLFLNI